MDTVLLGQDQAVGRKECGAEMRVPTGSRSEQHLPAWLSGRKAGAQEGRGAGKEPNEAEERRTDCLKELS